MQFTVLGVHSTKHNEILILIHMTVARHLLKWELKGGADVLNKMAPNKLPSCLNLEAATPLWCSLNRLQLHLLYLSHNLTFLSSTDTHYILLIYKFTTPQSKHNIAGVYTPTF